MLNFEKKYLEQQEDYDKGIQEIIAFNIEKDKIRREVKKMINEKQK